jgi:predicted phosphoribosyltransferase
MKARQKFVNGEDVARTFANRLIQYRDDPAGMVLTLPNRREAGIVASALLQLPVEVFIARDLQAPCHCPCMIGALTETDVVHLDEDVIAKQAWLHRELRAYIEREIQQQRAEIARQRQLLRSGRGLPEMKGRTRSN